MGIFDFFRSRSSRRSSQSNKNGSSANADVPASASGVSHSSTFSGAPVQVAKPPATASKAPVPSSLDSAATTASVSSNNNNNNEEDEDDSSDSELKSPAAPPVSLGSIQNYEIVKELGRGATAVVQLGKQKDGEQLVALKVFKTSLLKKMREVKRVGRKMVVSTALDKVQVEIAIMKKLKHANLLNLLEVFDDDSETLVLMLEYAPMGQIMHWDANERVYRATNDQVVLVNGGSTVFQEDELRNCARQLLLGLEYLHENNICHRDLKPENILVAGDGVYKIADFGVAHLFEETKEAAVAAGVDAPSSGSDNQMAEKKKGYVSSTAGTYAFMAPETLKGGAYDAYAADVWALGITLHALALGRIPFYNPDVVALFEQIETNPIVLESDDNNNEGVSSELAEFLYGLLEKDSEKRWSLAQCKRSPWLLEGLDEVAKSAFLDTKYEQVTVDSEDVKNAVTKVSSFNVLLRVKLGANRWLRKAQKSSDERRRASMNADDFPRSAPTSMNSVDESPEVEDKKIATEEKAVAPLSDNQAEI